ncbi:hypothetical protein IWW40_003742 [Coemansia sp. RSA 1250]|nr:hypothetical protein LPJ68_002170 [Coemansia sp. RSA 1086]KAJ2648678.1 hypothetical protein IWW40_003742 [Coemansia sp. RSA 1250]
MAAYEYIAAELSREEQDSVREIVEAHFHQCTSKQIMDILIAEHPLCLESDLLEEFNEVVAQLAQHNQHSLQQNSKSASPLTSLASSAGKSSISEMDPEDPNNFNNSRWTAEETQRLMEYLDATKGRKSWIKCAQYVGTRSSAQCKAKHNNMRAQEITRDIFEV